MAADIADLLRSLLQVTREETEILGQPGARASLDGLVRSKIRLVGALEERVTRLARETPGWHEALAGEMREELSELAQALTDAARTNATRLERQIDLAEDVITAIEKEARRQRGNSSAFYGAQGRILHADLPSPISVNTSL